MKKMGVLLFLSFLLTSRALWSQTPAPLFDMSDPIQMQFEENRSIDVLRMLFIDHPRNASNVNYNSDNFLVHIPGETEPYLVEDLVNLKGSTYMSCIEGFGYILQEADELLNLGGVPTQKQWAEKICLSVKGGLSCGLSQTESVELCTIWEFSSEDECNAGAESLKNKCKAPATLNVAQKTFCDFYPDFLAEPNACDLVETDNFFPAAEIIFSDIRDKSLFDLSAFHSGEHLAPYASAYVVSPKLVSIAHYNVGNQLDGIVAVSNVPALQSIPLNPNVGALLYHRLSATNGITRFQPKGYSVGWMDVCPPLKQGGQAKSAVELADEGCVSEDSAVDVDTLDLDHTGSQNILVTNSGMDPITKKSFVTIYSPKPNANFSDEALTFDDLFQYRDYAGLPHIRSATNTAVIKDRIGVEIFERAIVIGKSDSTTQYYAAKVKWSNGAPTAVEVPLKVGLTAQFDKNYYPYQVSGGDLNQDGCGDFVMTWAKPKTLPNNIEGPGTLECPAFFEAYLNILANGQCSDSYSNARYYAPPVDKTVDGLTSSEAQICAAIITPADKIAELGEGLCNDANRDCIPDVWMGDHNVYTKEQVEQQVLTQQSPYKANAFVSLYKGQGNGQLDIIKNVQTFRASSDLIESPDFLNGVKALAVDRYGNLAVSMGRLNLQGAQPSYPPTCPDGSPPVNGQCPETPPVDDLCPNGVTPISQGCPCPPNTYQGGKGFSVPATIVPYDNNGDGIVDWCQCSRDDDGDSWGDVVPTDNLEGNAYKDPDKIKCDNCPNSLKEQCADSGVVDNSKNPLTGAAGNLIYHPCFNPLQSDTDGDKLGDVCDVIVEAPNYKQCVDINSSTTITYDLNDKSDSKIIWADLDYDDVPDTIWEKSTNNIYNCDNCPPSLCVDNSIPVEDYCYNPDQKDTSGIKGLGDKCTFKCGDGTSYSAADLVYGGDSDKDGVPDFKKMTNSGGKIWGIECDNCKNVKNPLQVDSNGNEIGDACEGGSGNLFIPDRFFDPTPNWIGDSTTLKVVDYSPLPQAAKGLFDNPPEASKVSEQVSVLINKTRVSTEPPTPSVSLSDCKVDIGRNGLKAGLHVQEYVTSLNDKVRAITGLPVDIFIGELGQFDAYCVIPDAQPVLFNGAYSLGLYEEKGALPINYSNQLYRPTAEDVMPTAIQIIPSPAAVISTPNTDILGSYNLAVSSLPQPTFSFSVPGLDDETEVELDINATINKGVGYYQINNVIQADMGYLPLAPGGATPVGGQGAVNVDPALSGDFYVHLQGFSAVDLCLWLNATCPKPYPLKDRFKYTPDQVIAELQELVDAKKAAGQAVTMDIFKELNSAVTWDTLNWAHTKYVIPTGNNTVDVNLFMVNMNAVAQGGCNCKFNQESDPLQIKWMLGLLMTLFAIIFVYRHHRQKTARKG